MIPDFQSLMLPFLKCTGDNQEHSTKEIVETSGNTMNLTEEEKREMLPINLPKDLFELNDNPFFRLV